MSPAAPTDATTPDLQRSIILGPVRIFWRRTLGQESEVDWRLFYDLSEVAVGRLSRATPKIDVALSQVMLVGSLNLSFQPDMTLWCEMRAVGLPLTRQTLEVWPASAEVAETPEGCAS